MLRTTSSSPSPARSALATGNPRTPLLILALLLLSRAIAFSALPPGDHARTLRVGSLERRYTVHVPSRYEPGKPTPLVVMLHGGGGTGRAAAHETGWPAKADAEGFIVAFPDALARDPSRPSHFSRNPQLWNDGSDRFYQGQQRVDDVGFLGAMLDELGTLFTIDPRRVFFAGFSNGASMTFRAAAELSPRIAAIVPVAGACWLEAPRVRGPVSMCYITGDADPLNPIAGGPPRLASGGSDPVRAKAKPPVKTTIERWTKALGCPAEPTRVTEAAGVRTEIHGPGPAGAEAWCVTVAGLGHVWPGGKNILPKAMVGAPSDRLRGTDFAWEFFRTHPRPGDETAKRDEHPAPVAAGASEKRPASGQPRQRRDRRRPPARGSRGSAIANRAAVAHDCPRISSTFAMNRAGPPKT